jgi:hypothetical protein
VHIRAPPDLSRIGLEFAEQQLEQRGLARAIGSNEADAIASSPHREVEDQWPGVKRPGDALGLEDHLAAARATSV